MSSTYMARLEAINTACIGRVGHMRLSKLQVFLVAFIVGCLVTYLYVKNTKREGFQVMVPSCSQCGENAPCPEHPDAPVTPPSCPPMPDLSKYVLKTSIPPCPAMPELTNYMLKTECPPVPDLSQYVLKTSIPKQQPIIIDTSADVKAKCGDCPPCPRPRCPEVKCPAPTVCPAAAPCPRAVCPQTTVKCRAEETDNSPVRPFLAPLGIGGFGM
jgi:hypothetical protein